jgi:hypothetical protein
MKLLRDEFASIVKLLRDEFCWFLVPCPGVDRVRKFSAQMESLRASSHYSCIRVPKGRSSYIQKKGGGARKETMNNDEWNY